MKRWDAAHTLAARNALKGDDGKAYHALMVCADLVAAMAQDYETGEDLTDVAKLCSSFMTWDMA